MDFFLIATLLILATVSSANGACNGNTTVGIGQTIIASDEFPLSYADYTFCRWFITGPPNTQLQLVFIGDFDVETSPECRNDALYVYDTARPGSAENIASMDPCAKLPTGYGPMCGQEIPAPLTVTGNTAVVQFCSDYAVTGFGWKISLSYTELTAVSTPTWIIPTITLTNMTEINTIESPNYPAYYYHDFTATYLILNTQKDRAVNFRSTSFNLGLDCNDTVTITDVTNNITYTFCGRKKLFELDIVDSEEIHIAFVTDAYDNYKGFSIDVTLVPCPAHHFACDVSDGCYNTTQACDGVRNCPDGSDEKWEYCAPECGKNHFPMKPPGRIVGGTIISTHSLPWQAAMLVNGRQNCGGTIISDQWILSAAHCFDNGRTDPEGQSVRIGGHTLTLDPVLDRAVVIDFQKVICHPYFSLYMKYDYDYCLIKLKEKIPFRKNIAPACLPGQGADIAVGTLCMTSGWGDTRDTLNSWKQLKQVYMPVVDRTVCNATYEGRITDRMVCAGVKEGGLDSCQGDSGGPFVCQTKDGRWIASGVVSWGRDCGLPDVPGVYARTGSVSHWIIDTIATN